jgi:hypothetical protein
MDSLALHCGFYELGFYHSDLKAFKLNFDEHLRANPNSEIIGELNRVNAVLQDFILQMDL